MTITPHQALGRNGAAAHPLQPVTYYCLAYSAHPPTRIRHRRPATSNYTQRTLSTPRPSARPSAVLTGPRRKTGRPRLPRPACALPEEAVDRLAVANPQRKAVGAVARLRRDAERVEDRGPQVRRRYGVVTHERALPVGAAVH